MIAAGIYLLLIAALIRYNGFFGIFRDDKISKTFFTCCFILKAAAIPLFYLVYTKIYSGLIYFDSGKLFHDVQVINDYAFEQPLNFLKIIFGLQDDSRQSDEFRQCLVKTLNWDNGITKEFRLNDNRLLIRVHALLHFISFNSWWVHALLSCFCSFAGITFIYRSFKHFFSGKEKLLLLVFCFFPSLWFFTGGFLKEGLTVLVLGAGILELKYFVHHRPTFRSIRFALLIVISLVLKPYLLLWSLLCFFLFFFISTKRWKYRSLIFCSSLICFFGLIGVSLQSGWSKGSLATAIRHQQVFLGVARGGIFLARGDYYLQLKYDTSQVKKVQDSVYTIKKGVSYMYWDDANNNDTLYNTSNEDTVTKYRLVFMNPEAHSNLPVAGLSGSLLDHVAASFQNTFLRPFFYQAKGIFGWVASIENLILLFSFLFTIAGILFKRKQVLLPVTLICFVTFLFILIGITTPNTGAILRYRCPVAGFLLISALYYLGTGKYKENSSV